MASRSSENQLPDVQSGSTVIRNSLIVAVLALGLVSIWLRSGLEVLAEMEHRLRLSQASSLAVLLTFSGVYAVCQALVAFPVAEFGSRRLVSFGLFLSALGATGTAVASDLNSLIVSNTLLGAGLSVVVAARCAMDRLDLIESQVAELEKMIADAMKAHEASRL
jgi:hypothetical protein